MRVNRLETAGFRNLVPGILEPASGVNVLYGDNAQGKTNVLEALWLFTGGRSFRGAKDAEMVGFGRPNSRCVLDFTAQERDQQAVITIEKRRSAVLNGVPQTNAAKLAGVFCAVVFSPVHLALIKDGPEGRRRFVDAAYCQLRPGYVQTLTAFTRTLTQRNALLRQDTAEDAVLDVWDERLAQAGARVRRARAAYIARLREAARPIYAGLSGGREQLELRYQVGTGADTSPTDIPEPEAQELEKLTVQLRESLRAQRRADRAAGFTTGGPHRDDLVVAINGVAARSFASQGQQRSAVLALKLAEATLLRSVTGEQPVALLDDVMSELDVTRQDYILNHLHDWQVFITCCDPAAVLRLTGGRAFHIRGGAVMAEGDQDAPASR